MLSLLLLLAGGWMSPVLWAEKPVALVGDSYGKHDVTSLKRNIFDRTDWVVEEKGGFLPADQFRDYSLVFIAHSVARPYTAEEQAIIETYVREGGTVVLMHHAPRRMADDESRDAFQSWFGMEFESGGALAPESLQFADEALLEGLPNNPPPAWVEERAKVTRFGEGVTPLIGADGKAVVARRTLGKGKVYFLGSHLFRMRQPKSDFYASSDSYVNLIQGILAEARPQSRSVWKEGQREAYRKAGRRFLLWDREWQSGVEEGPVFEPPLPEEKELKAEWQAHLAVNEAELFQLNFTDLGAGGKVTWKIDRGALPETAVEWFVQDKPDPIPWPKNPAIARESPYWLMPPAEVEPKGEEAVLIAPGKTRIFWLKLRSAGVAPGRYAVSVEWLVDGKSAATAKFDVTVHPVHLPRARRITLQPFGTGYGDVNRAAPAERFHRNLEDLGFEWGYVNIFRPNTFRVNGEILTPGWIKAHGAEIAGGADPAIDFSSIDPFIDSALRHGLTRFRVTDSLTKSIRGLTRHSGLDAPVADAVHQWYQRQVAGYFRDKGVREFFVSQGDELSVEELRERYLPWSEDLGRSGWRTSSSFTTSIVRDPELAAELARNVGAWTLNRLYLREFQKWRREGKIQLPPGTLVGSYGAGEGRGTEIRKPYSASQMIGWEAWALGSDYCSPNPYFKGWLYYVEYRQDRGVSGERFVAYLHADDLEAPLVNSPFVEGIRESMEGANLASILSWYLEKLGSRVPEEVHQRAAKIVGEDDAILRWKERRYGGYQTSMIDSSRDDYRRARTEVLHLLDEVAEAGRELPVEIAWQTVPLVKGGKAVAHLTAADGIDVAPIQQALRTRGGPELPVGPGKADVQVVVGPEVPEALRAGMPVFSSASTSWLRDWKDKSNGKTILWVGGVDAAETARAVHRFGLFLKAEGDWLMAQ